LILGVGNLFVEVVEGHDSLGSKLPLSLILQGNLPTKDVIDASVGILVGMTRVLVMFFFGLVLLISLLVVSMIVFVTIFVAFCGCLSGRWTSDPYSSPLYGQSLGELSRDLEGP
jgi:hypothetical protein